MADYHLNIQLRPEKFATHISANFEEHEGVKHFMSCNCTISPSIQMELSVVSFSDAPAIAEIEFHRSPASEDWEPPLEQLNGFAMENGYQLQGCAILVPALSEPRSSIDKLNSLHIILWVEKAFDSIWTRLDRQIIPREIHIAVNGPSLSEQSFPGAKSWDTAQGKMLGVFEYDIIYEHIPLERSESL